jgi:hypothetical protein
MRSSAGIIACVLALVVAIGVVWVAVGHHRVPGAATKPVPLVIHDELPAAPVSHQDTVAAPPVTPGLLDRVRVAAATPPPRSTRPEVAVLSKQRSGQRPCATLLGTWHVNSGAMVNLQPAGRASWQAAGSELETDIRWLCQASGAIELQLPGGSVLLTSSEDGKTLAGSGSAGVTMEAHR